MNKEKDIQRLIELFMEGKTTLEEEDALSEYFRTHAVPPKWDAYKEMFGYFGEGMPMGRYEAGSGGKSIRKRVLFTALAAAAAIALLFVVTWKGWNSVAYQAEPQPQTASLAPDTASASPADTVSKPSQKPATTTKRRKTSKYKYRIAPPKTYYAAAEGFVSASVEDSILRNERLIAAQMRSAEIAEQLLLRKLELMEMAHDMETALAAEDESAEGEAMEAVY